jgi:pyrophosphatase PpaX
VDALTGPLPAASDPAEAQGPSARRYGAVLFDLDGTLIDTIGLILDSHRHALRTVLGVEAPDEALRAGIGQPLMEQMRQFDAEHAERLHETYRAYNHAHTNETLRWFPGLRPVLRGIKDDGVKLGVVTSKMRDAVDLAFRLRPPPVEFDALVTMESTSLHKPRPEPLLHACSALGVAAADACYVGDAAFDMQAARAAGCGAVAVTWGVATKTQLMAERPDAIAASPRSLGRLLRSDT